MLGDFDKRVLQYLRNLCLAGSIVNRTVAVAAATGIIRNANPALLKENSGVIDVTEAWAKVLRVRMNFVRRKGTKSARHLPTDLVNIKHVLLESIATLIEEHKISHELLINFDQTGSKFVPVSEWSMEKRGSKQVSLPGLDDKQEMTVLLGISAAGMLQPPQLLYAGQTEKCHSSIAFPPGWDAWHTESHWSISKTLLRYAKNIFTLYVRNVSCMLGLLENQIAIALLNVFKAHQDNTFLQDLHDYYIIPVFTLVSFTEELQQMDFTVNGEF